MYVIFVNLAVATIMIQIILSQQPSFRIIAPQIICAKDKNGDTDKPDTTSVMIQTRPGVHLGLEWTVRWVPLTAPSQRFTLLLWRSVRKLETALNRVQPESFLYVIDNSKLLEDVDYIFNVTAATGGNEIEQYSFSISNVSGKRKLELGDGHADKFSLVLLGSLITYPDMEYILEAEVGMCHPTQDYQFVWTIAQVDGDDIVDTSYIGSRLTLPPGTLKAAHSYDIGCEIIRSSDKLFINQMTLNVQVLNRQLQSALDCDVLVISKGNQFDTHVTLYNQDYLEDTFKFKWWCKYEAQPCEFFESVDGDYLMIPSGLPNVGIYEIGVIVSGDGIATEAEMTVIVLEPKLPVLKINPVQRTLNEGTHVSLVGNVSYITPSCSLTWYFISYLNYTHDNCRDCENGESISETVTINSIEETFLNELADFSNVTEWHQVTAEFMAMAGRARLYVDCGCSFSFSCDTNGSVHADLYFDLNRSPVVGEITITPASGLALQTIFTIRTQAAQDDDMPLLYSFYTRVGDNMSLLLDTFLDHMTIDTVLPYIDGVTEIWMEVCDSKGACAQSDMYNVAVKPGDINMDLLKETIGGHFKRCELFELRRLSVIALVTFNNSEQWDFLSTLSTTVTETLSSELEDRCADCNTEYDEILDFFKKLGFLTSY